MTSPENFRHQTSIAVRFADLDVLGHLNNATYLSYIEHARIEYIREVCGWQGAWQTLGMILAKTIIEYQLPVIYDDTVTVWTRCARLGGKSFDLEYLMMRQQGDNPPDIAATCTTVMVSYDYEQETTIRVPDTWRTAIIDYEPAKL